MDGNFGIGQLIRAVGMMFGGWLGWRYGFADAARSASFWGDSAQWMSGMVYGFLGAIAGVAAGAGVTAILKAAMNRRR